MAKKLKRITAVLCIICLAISAIVTVPFAAENDVNATEFEMQKKFLGNIGILKFDIEDPGATLVRGQFADMAMRSCIKDWPSYEMAETFNDVIPNYEYKDAIEAGYLYGVIRGVEEDVFGVNMKITPKEAVTIMLRILNYEKYIEAYGSFDEHYQRVAIEIGLLKGVDLKAEELSFEDAVQLLYNALDIVPFKVSYSSDGVRYDSENQTKTLLNDALGIIETEGIMTANRYTDLEGGSSAGDGNVRIDGITYPVGETDADDFIGCNVHMYYDEESGEILYIEDDDSEITKIESPDECEYSGGVLTYWQTEKSRGKSIDIGVDSIIVYNNSLVRGGQFDESLFNIDVGNITVIEDSVGGHTTVIIKSYTDTVFDRCIEGDDEYILISKFEPGHNIFIPDGGMFDIEDENGTKLMAADIPADTVISAAVSLDGSCGHLIVNTTSAKLTQAYVLEADEESVILKTYAEEMHTYVENKYQYTKYFEEKNKENIIKPGSEYTAYIDAFGYVAYLSSDVDMSDFYAYVIKAYIDDSIDEEVWIRVFRDDGKVMTYKAAENIVVDGVACKKKTATEIISLLGFESELKSRLIYMSLTFDSEIKSIDTCLEETDEREADYSLYKSQREDEDTLYKIDGSVATYASTIPGRRRYYSETKSFDTGILLSSSTKILAIPLDSDVPGRFKVLTTASFMNDRCYNVKAYGRDDDTISPDVLLYFYYSRYNPDIDKAIATGNSHYACLPFERTYDADTGIVTACSKAVNPDTDEVENVIKITNVRSGAQSVYYTDDDILTEGISSGQIVRYFLIGGSLCYLEKLYSLPDKAFNEDIRTIKWVNGKTSVPSYFLTHNGTYLADSYGATATENPVYGIARGVIVNNNKTHIAYVTYDNYESGSTEQKNLKYYACSSVKVYKYNERTKLLETKNFDDIVAYDESNLLNSEVVIITKNKSVLGIIIY